MKLTNKYNDNMPLSKTKRLIQIADEEALVLELAKELSKTRGIDIEKENRFTVLKNRVAQALFE